jgi:hypothetical protein
MNLKDMTSSLSDCIYLLSKESWNYNETVVPEVHRDMVVSVLKELIEKIMVVPFDEILFS